MVNNKNNMKDIPIEYRIALAKSISNDKPEQYMTGKDIAMWDSAARKTGGLGTDYDYGAIGTTDSRGHGSDAGKLMNHPTFSNQSIYSGVAGLDGGSWNQNTFTPTEWQHNNESEAFRQWLVDTGRTDGDVYIGKNGNTLNRSK